MADDVYNSVPCKKGEFHDDLSNFLVPDPVDPSYANCQLCTAGSACETIGLSQISRKQFQSNKRRFNLCHQVYFLLLFFRIAKKMY